MFFFAFKRKNGNFFLVHSRALEYNKISFFHMFKSYNKKNGKTDESLRRKAIGPVKW